MSLLGIIVIVAFWVGVVPFAVSGWRERGRQLRRTGERMRRYERKDGR